MTGKKLITLSVWVVLLSVVFLVWRNRRDQRAADSEAWWITESDALQMLSENDVESYDVESYGTVLSDRAGDLYVVEPTSLKLMSALSVAEISFDPDLMTAPPEAAGSGDSWLPTLLLGALAVLAAVYFLRRFAGSGHNNLFELRKTKARSLEDGDKLTFDDIGGNEGAIELLSDVVDYLRNPGSWKKAGARPPRGILLVGPPGTGKTMLARAVAGETDAAFFYTTASEFVEMFVGIGAARVRSTFENAVSASPAVVFIDELDAVGRKRNSGMGTMHEEREQTLNQLLVLMDGTERNYGVVVIAATNRPDVLDSALMRPGRFDRIVRLKAPDEESRRAIIRIHLKGKSIDESLSVDSIARDTAGFTGADIETTLNEAAVLALRRARNQPDVDSRVTAEDVRAAMEELRRGGHQFDKLDAVLVESVTQFAEPTGRAVARVTTVNGDVVDGDVLWMNGTHLKLRTADGRNVIIAKEMAATIEPLHGTEEAGRDDVAPDRWTGPNLDVG